MFSIKWKKTCFTFFDKAIFFCYSKAGTFVDRRFGEFDSEMSLEERMLKRFTLEKQVCL